jgi:hypothetical protein
LNAATDFFHYNTDDTLISWIHFILGLRHFIDINNIPGALGEAENEDPGIMLRVNDELKDQRDFAYIEALYQQDLVLYADVSETHNRTEEENSKTNTGARQGGSSLPCLRTQEP